jgi:lipoate---protein ligase
MLKKGYNIYKASKLIKILLEYEENHHQENIRTVSSIKITGDFFLYPEDSLEYLEMQLRGTWLEKANLKKKIDECLSNAEPYGFDSESLSDAIMGCLNNQEQAS